MRGVGLGDRRNGSGLRRWNAGILWAKLWFNVVYATCLTGVGSQWPFRGQVLDPDWCFLPSRKWITKTK